MSNDKLTPKQEAFAQRYVELGNASEAYRQTYNAKNMKTETIHVKACELLATGKVAVRVQALQQRALEQHDITMDDIVTRLRSIGWGNIFEFIRVNEDGEAVVDLTGLTEESARAISSIKTTTRIVGKGDDRTPITTTEFKLHDPRPALMDIAKLKGLAPDKLEVSGPGGKPIQHAGFGTIDEARRLIFAVGKIRERETQKIEGGRDEA